MESHEFIDGVEMFVVQCVLLCVVSPSRHGKAKEFMTGMSMEVTVGDLTVVITDYEPKPKRKRSSTDSHDSSSFLSNTDTGSPSLSNGRAPDWGAGFVERPAAFLIACFVWLYFEIERCVEMTFWYLKLRQVLREAERLRLEAQSLNGILMKWC